MAFTVEQGGDAFQVEPLSHGDQTVEAFYSYGDPDGASANTPTGLEASDVSQLFLYEGPDGTSLVIIHDEPNDGDGGDVHFEFDTLPADGAWVVKDDGGEGYGRTYADWRWVSCCTDGGAFRGGFDGAFSVTITPSFNAGIDTWQFLSGSASSPDRHALDRGQSVTISSGGRTVSTSATLLSFLPGGNENTAEGGNPLDSALLQLFEPNETFEFEFDLGLRTIRAEVTTSPVLDNWLTGDMIEADSVPTDIGDVSPDPDKYEETAAVAGHQFRLRSDAEVTFDVSSEGSIDRDSIEVHFDGISAASVLEGEDLNNLDDDLASDDGVVPGGYRPRYYDHDVITVDGTEAVRVSTVFGGYTRVAAQLLDLIRSRSLANVDFFTDVLEWEIDVSGPDIADDVVGAMLASAFYAVTTLFAAVPNIFTFLELVVTAENEQFVRLWDASKFPRHTIYLGGTQRRMTDLPFEQRQRCNLNLFAFFGEAGAGVGPYHTSHWLYYTWVRFRPFVDLVGGWIDDRLEDLPCDVEGSYTDLVPPAGVPMEQFSNGDHSETDIADVLPPEPLYPFVDTVSHGP